MAQYTYNVNLSPLGVCPPKFAREVKQALSLSKKPKIFYVGSNQPGTDNLISGEITVKVRELTPAEQTIVTGLLAVHNPCEPFESENKPDAGVDLDDLDDFMKAMPGTIIFVRDLPRLTNGKGCHVYRTNGGFRRMSDDTVVEIPS